MRNKVAEVRKKRGLTQQELSEKANISRPYLCNIENDQNKVVSNTIMFRLADALGVNVSDIFLP